MGNISRNGKLVIARHHESEWNKSGQWTGLRDRHLTDYGFEKSTEMGELIKDVKIDAAFASMQVRSIETLSCMLEEQNLFHVPTVHSLALNERDYGDYTGKNKWEMEELIGHDEWNKIRRGWDHPVPNGETLKMVYERVLPFYLNSILPLLKSNKNVLLVSHGNAIRALMKYIEKVSDEGVEKIEMLFGVALVYLVDNDGHMLTKEIKKIHSEVNA